MYNTSIRYARTGWGVVQGGACHQIVPGDDLARLVTTPIGFREPNKASLATSIAVWTRLSETWSAELEQIRGTRQPCAPWRRQDYVPETLEAPGVPGARSRGSPTWLRTGVLRGLWSRHRERPSSWALSGGLAPSWVLIGPSFYRSTRAG